MLTHESTSYSVLYMHKTYSGLVLVAEINATKVFMTHPLVHG